MKTVWLVWKTEYQLPWPHHTLKGLYASKESAENAALEFNKEEGVPVESDDYGPLSGTEFTVYENEVKP